MSNLILGLDPGTRKTGFGVLSQEKGVLRHVAHGVIDLPERLPLAERLNRLALELDTVFTRFKPSVASVEKIFFGVNADSAFKLGHARGVCLMMVARHGAGLHEYAARFVKKCVTGSGAATKDQVQLVVGQLLKLKTLPTFDASDALALAITHSREAEAQGLIRKAQRAMEREL
jgi:crossover junction endodeoxyribonuclease RuvC